MTQAKKGRLKIFFSYAESIGKTQAMLKAALTAKKQGVDVVVGYIAMHTIKQNTKMLHDFEILDPENFTFHIERALERNPGLILIDELAHGSTAGSRHKKRYQEVDELLQHGIDVYTTVNVGNIESLHDTVASITGITTWDRIPDSIFDDADQVELIDIEPQELIERLKEQNTADSLLTVEQLTALREIALRRCADRVNRLSCLLPEKNRFHTDEHILACLSSAPSNAKIIRTAARMARAFNSQFTALFVETPEFAAMATENKKRLDDNRKLAEQLGAAIETVYGEDVPYQIAEYARLSGVTKIVLGRSTITRRHLLGKPTLTEQLLSYAPDIDIHIIPDRISDTPYQQKKTNAIAPSSILKNSVISGVILLLATLLSILFEKLSFTDSNIIMIYILGVMLTSIVTSHRVYSLISSVASVCIFNFLFTMPKFSLTAYGTGSIIIFIVMFLTAYITGTLAIRYKAQARQSAKIAYRTKILFDTDQLLSKANGREEILHATAKQIQKLLERDVVIFGNVDGTLSEPFSSPDSNDACDPSYLKVERTTAEWVLINNHAAGATTDTHADAQYLYLSIHVNDRVYGVIGIDAKDAPLDAFAYSMLLSILGEAALALENDRNAHEKEAAAILAESEQLRANLLRAISHDLRTPLTTISGNASSLIHNGSSFNEDTKQQIYSDIYNDSIWLINIVENLLYATRIEDGRMTLHTSAELLSEIVEEAVRHSNYQVNNRPLTISHQDDLMLVKVDAKLVVQVIVNIIDNAVKYTPKNSPITITTRKFGNMAEVCIADTGSGISQRDKAHIFEKFYCGNQKIADNRRSLGLGLYLCKAIVEAHNGTISATDNQPHGTIFRFTLPLEELTFHDTFSNSGS